MEFFIFTLVRAAGYLSIALGFALVYGAARVLNLSHGAFYLIGAYWAHWIASLSSNTPAKVALAYLGAVTTTAVMGGLFFRLVLRPAARDPNRTMILCLAANFAVAEVLRALFGSRGILVPALVRGNLELAGVALARQQALILPLSLALLAATALVLYRTRAGLAIRSVAQDPEGAEVLGIRSATVLGWTFVASSAMAAFAACLITPSTVVGPSGWIAPLVKSFAIVVLGGAHHLRATVVASLILAAAEVGGAYWISEGAAEYVSLCVIIATLLIRPRGLVHED